MQRLREVTVDHPLTPIAQTSRERASTEDFGSVAGEVERFLNEPETVSLTMTIRFTDDALSLGREENGCGMTFYTHPRRDPEEHPRILSLFAGLGVPPRVDRLFDRGRTHELQFPISSERGAIASLCVRVLTEVYSMRRGDVLDYYPLKKSDVPGRH